ncbi:MAG TPA: glycosyltransferase [Solirubrobacteraceae bacterium]|jgi:glycosyltransferase involved in cell wall biosynthesis|nr:glycosyltransferase [Solirubrobacteraceae bacterium]
MEPDVTPSFAQRLAGLIVDWFDARQLVTWERHDQNARLLMITNVWPYDEQPAYGPYVRDIADELCRQGLISDVLFIRGYRTSFAYVAGALTSLLLPLAYPNKYLLVHSHGGETSLAARFYPDGPVLASYLGTDILGTQVGGGLRLRAKCWLRSLVLRAHAATMSATTTKSHEMETLLISRARPRNSVIPDGVDRQRFHPMDRTQARAELGWPSDQTIVLFAGRAQSPEKRLWLARSAIDIVREQIPDIQLQIDEVVPPSEMPLHYAAADCLLHTSVSEGSPCVVKEALACDLPVVATPSGDVRDLLAGVDACEVCEAEPNLLAEALIRVLRLGQSNGRERTEHLSLEATTRRTLECYQDLGFPVSRHHAVGCRL